MSMPTPIAVMRTHSDIGRVVAQGILDQLRTTGRATVGFPAGRTATPVAAALTMLAHEQNARLDGLSIVMMDEYVTGQPGAWHVLPSAEPHSCIGPGRVAAHPRRTAQPPPARPVQPPQGQTQPHLLPQASRPHPATTTSRTPHPGLATPHPRMTLS